MRIFDRAAGRNPVFLWITIRSVELLLRMMMVMRRWRRLSTGYRRDFPGMSHAVVGLVGC